jgi:hypothetical protein
MSETPQNPPQDPQTPDKPDPFAELRSSDQWGLIKRYVAQRVSGVARDRDEAKAEVMRLQQAEDQRLAEERQARRDGLRERLEQLPEDLRPLSLQIFDKLADDALDVAADAIGEVRWKPANVYGGPLAGTLPTDGTQRAVDAAFQRRAARKLGL